MIAGLKGGTIDALVVQDPFDLGFQAVKTSLDKIHRITSPKQWTYSRRAQADPDKPDVHELLYPDVKKYVGSTKAETGGAPGDLR